MADEPDEWPALLLRLPRDLLLRVASFLHPNEVATGLKPVCRQASKSGELSTLRQRSGVSHTPDCCGTSA
jgi:hypothetical protein